MTHIVGPAASCATIQAEIIFKYQYSSELKDNVPTLLKAIEKSHLDGMIDHIKFIAFSIMNTIEPI